jgi:hypothetical protein
LTNHSHADHQKPLLILHLDGVGHTVLTSAVADGTMPFMASLLRSGYATQQYSPGLPSTTPYAQAGILYGDNTGIAGFRWYDKRSGVDVAFGVGSSFKRVAHRYFQGRRGLVEGGAAIAACYDGGARITFGLAYRERHYRGSQDAAGRIIGRFALNPVNAADAAWQLVNTTGATLTNYLYRRARGSHPARAYVLGDIAEETFVHHLTRFAVLQAIRDRISPIYACFYAYDESSHGFGPDDPINLHMLRHLDRTLAMIFKAGSAYEIVVLSDHGQTPAKPFVSVGGKRLHEVISNWLPTYEVRDLKVRRPARHEDRVDGHILIGASGGLAHIYLPEAPGALLLDEVEARCPGLIHRLAGHPGIQFLVGRRRQGYVLVDANGEVPLDSARGMLDAFEQPAIVSKQLSKLMSFPTAGDIILIGRFEDGHQVDFEDQLGTHGSIGGEQGRPFVLARSELGLDVRTVTDASELFGILRGLVG